MIIGLTGGIACGKTFCSKLFAEKNFQVIHTDDVAKEILATNLECKKKCIQHFGEQCFEIDGALNKSFLAARIFNSPSDKRFLESILHPLVHIKWKQMVKNRSECHSVVEIPLLYEKNLSENFDFVICIATSKKLQLDRLRSRGLSLDEAQGRISAQLPLEHKIQKADYVLFSSNSKNFLKKQFLILLNKHIGI